MILVNLRGTSAGAVKAWQVKKAKGTVIKRTVTRTIANAPIPPRKQPKPPSEKPSKGKKGKKPGRPKKPYKVAAGRRIAKPVVVGGVRVNTIKYKGGAAKKGK